ncbi:MAG: GNAT family N-acetyltransferase [Eubacteriaceae bacterium]|nr:GNAT family N-acetyltransferase [Eubacteriaceae bacterium]
MDNRYILNTALMQSAEDLSCSPEDLMKDENTVVISRKNEKARRYLSLPFELNLVTYGRGIVASCSEEISGIIGKYIDVENKYSCFEAPYVNHLADMVSPYGLKPCFMAEYFLPDVEREIEMSCKYEVKVLHPEDFASLYLPEWSNAICEKRKHLDILGLGAYDDGKLVGFAGCSMDCEEMWQIGIDVIPDYRREGIASYLTYNLSRMIVKNGKVPFYCAAYSNIPSVRNAIRSGFYPAWVELTCKPSEFTDEMNRSIYGGRG